MSDSTPIIASVWRRIGGGLCDLTCIFIFCVLSGISNIDATNNRINFSMEGWASFVAFFFSFLIFAWMEYKTGKTPGKYVFNTRVTTENYQKISFKQSLYRNFFRIIDGIGGFLIGLIIIICTTKNQRLGDLIAKTYVVKD